MAIPDYLPHHELFQYYKTTANPDHLPESPIENELGVLIRDIINTTCLIFGMLRSQAIFQRSAFLKLPAFQDGHAGYSNPLNEQAFIVETINRIQKLSEWKDNSSDNSQ